MPKQQNVVQFIGLLILYNLSNSMYSVVNHSILPSPINLNIKKEMQAIH